MGDAVLLGPARPIHHPAGTGSGAHAGGREVRGDWWVTLCYWDEPLASWR